MLSSITTRVIAIGILALSYSQRTSAAADSSPTFSDNFSDFQNSNSGFQSFWKVPAEKGWSIQDLWVNRAGASDSDEILNCTKIVLPEKWTISADVKIDAHDRAHFGGIAFNIQNDSNYYVFRVAISDEDQCGYYQILTRRNNEWESWEGPSFSKFEMPSSPSDSFTISVESKSPGRYKFTIKDSTKELMVMDEEITPKADALKGGTAGLFLNGMGSSLSNFSIDLKN